MTITLSNNTVSSAAVRDVYLACKKLGLLSDTVTNNLEIDASLFDDPQARILEASLIQLWNILEQNNDHPGMGLLIGQTIAPESKGILASWVSQAGTLKEALSIFFENIKLMNPSESWQVLEQESQVTLILENKHLDTYPPCAIERSMSAIVAWARVLSGSPFPLRSTTFTFPRPSYVKMFAPIFGEHLYFKAQTNSLTFDKSLLDCPVVSSNQLLKSLMEEKAKAALAQLSNGTGVSEKVRLLIENALSQGQTLSIEQTCRILAKSRQTLYRQLQQESTDFKTIYDATRKEQAFSLLKSKQVNIGAIGLQLGYKDSSSFYKAFRRWTGMSPGDYQKKLDHRVTSKQSSQI
jgi:AraC-like DNA-binding protein